jgi:hypothetical protein
MCELLIRFDNRIKGGIVFVAPDGYQWGKKERVPQFIILQIPGSGVSDFEFLRDHGLSGGTFVKHKYAFDINALSASQQTQIQTTSKLQINEIQFLYNNIVNRETGTSGISI